MSYKEEFEEWLSQRPAVVQALASQYPPGDYIVKEDAPYGVSAPGTTVNLIGYGEDGFVSVVVLAENKTQEALDHEEKLAKEHGMSDEELEKIHKMNIKVRVEPKWLELVTNELEDATNG